MNNLQELIYFACRYKFMNGWGGDRSEAFQEEQYKLIMDLPPTERAKWIDDMRERVEHHQQMLREESKHRMSNT